MDIQFLILYVLVGIAIALAAAIYFKVKTAIYLLEQPVVKKMSPQLNLKPVKTDHFEGSAPRNGTPVAAGHGRPEGRDGRDRGPREGGRDRDRSPRGEREGEPRREGGDRGPRGEGDRGPRGEGERAPRGDRGERGDRFGGREGGRDRGGRGEGRDRHDRGDRGPGGRDGRMREFSGSEREPAQASEARPAPTADVSSPAPLAPRRPLPSTVDAEGEVRPAAAPAALEVNEAGAADPFFGRDDSDIQHGRRTQLKKKPKFDAEEVEEKTEETKVL